MVIMAHNIDEMIYPYFGQNYGDNRKISINCPYTRKYNNKCKNSQDVLKLIQNLTILMKDPGPN